MSKSKSKRSKKNQSEINIGMIGHVDHGKSTLVEAFSGVFPDFHSEEIRRGISIRLGYADCEFRKCPSCEPPEAYTTEKKCPKCGSKSELLRKISFVDAPGHEVLMATMLSGAAIMDAVLLVVAANEKCPMPQTREHFAAMKVSGMNDILICQNKIELVKEEGAIENFSDIKNFLRTNSEEVAEKTPVIPISAIHKANLDVLIQTIEEKFPTPDKDPSLDARMLVARSFDINKPGSTYDELNGGVIGGAITQGMFEVGNEIEIRPGIKIDDKWEPLTSEVSSLRSGFGKVATAYPGGLIGVGTRLDPALTKNDQFVGHVAGKPGTLPPIWESLNFKPVLMERVVGIDDFKQIKQINVNENLMLNVGTAKTVGSVTGKAKKQSISVKLRIPVVAEIDERLAISMMIDRRWRLIGHGLITGGEALIE
ncbi:MAG: translation initiation factor IF-2 subunit gamma [Candidatus Hodarchaeales archaeon]|jgi:translation initiation factor 2 subunit 3